MDNHKGHEEGGWAQKGKGESEAGNAMGEDGAITGEWVPVHILSLYKPWSLMTNRFDSKWHQDSLYDW